MIELRDYQQTMISDARTALSKHKRVLLQAPTGAGKTALTVHMMGRAADRDKRSVFLVHQGELLKQTSKALWKQKLEHGMIASGKRRSGLKAQVASVQTLVNRLDDYEPFDFIIIDEAHRSTAPSYQRVLAAFPKAHVLGLTATPRRTDGRGLGEIYQDLVRGPSLRSLINSGWLCDYDMYAPPTKVDVRGIKKVAGDYDKGQLEAAMDRPTITGDAVEHYLKFVSGKRCVVMCVSVKHAEHVAEQYRAAGVVAACMDGTMTDDQRDTLLEDFAANKIQVLTAVQLLIEGVDVPAIEVVQWLRPTHSLIVWLQGNGRGFRTAPGKERLTIFDHVGNHLRHGWPDEDHDWSLEGKVKGKRSGNAEPDVQIQTCPKCRFTFLPGVSECPKCGAPVELKERKIEQVEGTLEKLERAQAEHQQKIEQRIERGMAKTIAELVALGMRRGLSNPHGWAANIFAARDGRKASPDDYKQARDVYLMLARAG